MRAALPFAVVLLGAGCTLLIDPDAGYPCDGAGQCAAGYRCIESECTKSGPTCGDYVSDPGEGCDDGPRNTNECPYGEQVSCTVCSPACAPVSGALTWCGDGAIDHLAGEACDDSNAATEGCTYGETFCLVCDSACHLAGGTTSYCGDGAADAGSAEGCDDGNTVTDACAYGEVSCTVCGPGCTAVAGIPSYCGDGAIDGANGELCDDSNAVAEPCAYGLTACIVCGATCRPEAGPTSYCGDGAADGANGEGCDDANVVTEACPYGQTACTVCDATCRSVAGATSYCGDGTPDAANGEECDDGNTLTEPCAYGDTSCTVCARGCRFAAGDTSYCGDFWVDSGAGEDCDEGDAVTEPCDYGLTSCSVCDASCVTVAGASSACGDGIVDGALGEGCDAAAANSDAPDASCRSDCTPQRCGDEIVDADEGCDRGAENLAACPAWLPTPPTVLCDAGCAPLSCPGMRACGDGAIDGAEGEACDLGADNGRCGQGCSKVCAPWSCDREWVWWTPPAAALPDSRYDLGVAGVATDQVTGIRWQRGNAPASQTHADAEAYCQGLDLGGSTGWRLPTLVELLSMIDYSRSGPAVNTSVFASPLDSYFWSSTPWSVAPGEHLIVSTFRGASFSSYGTVTASVRCVR